MKSMKIGNYTFSLDYKKQSIPHFCSGGYLYDLKMEIYEEDNGYTTYLPEELEREDALKIFSSLLADAIDSIAVNEHEYASDTSLRSLFYIGTVRDESTEGTYYEPIYGLMPNELFEALGIEGHLMHSDGYDKGSVVKMYSAELEAEYYYDDSDDRELSELYFTSPKPPLSAEELKNKYSEVLTKQEDIEIESIDSMIDGILGTGA